MPTVSCQPTSIRVSRIQVAVMLSLGIPGVVFLGLPFMYRSLHVFDDKFWKREILNYLFNASIFCGDSNSCRWGCMPIKVTISIDRADPFLRGREFQSPGSAQLRIHALDFIAATSPPATCRDAWLWEMGPHTCPQYIYLPPLYIYIYT